MNLNIELKVTVNRASDVNMIIHGLLYNRELITLPIKTLRRHLQKHRVDSGDTLSTNKLKTAKCKLARLIDDMTAFSNEVTAIREPSWIFVAFGGSRYSIKEMYLVKYDPVASSSSGLIQSMVEYFFKLPKPKSNSVAILHTTPISTFQLPFKISSKTQISSIFINQENSEPCTQNFTFEPNLQPQLTLNKMKR